MKKSMHMKCPLCGKELETDNLCKLCKKSICPKCNHIQESRKGMSWPSWNGKDPGLHTNQASLNTKRLESGFIDRCAGCEFETLVELASFRGGFTRTRVYHTRIRSISTARDG